MTDLSKNLTLCCTRGTNPAPIIATSSKPTQIPKNHILICVDRFGFSANNITYQALGEHPHYRYFDFHAPPTTHDQETSTSISPKTHGVVPVWGFGTVIASSLPNTKSKSGEDITVKVGERVYGYLAPTRYLLVEIDPTDVNKFAMYVPRRHLPADRRVYNQLTRCSSDPVYTKPTEDLIMLYRPLFWTSFWCEDWLYWEKYYDPSSSSDSEPVTMLISSASSKTAFCFAYCVRKRVASTTTSSSSSPTTKPPITLIGITSSKNLAFTKHLGLYDQVYSYDEFTQVPALNNSNSPRPTPNSGSSKWIYVDVAGNSSLNARVYKHFESPYMGTLALSVSLGMTNLMPGSANVATTTSGSGVEEKTNGILGADNKTMSGHSGKITSTLNAIVNIFKPGSGTTTTTMKSTVYPPKLESFFTPEWLDMRRERVLASKRMDLKTYNREFFETQKKGWEGLMRDCMRMSTSGGPWVEVERVYNGNGSPGANKNKIQGAYEEISREGIPPDKGMIWSMWSGEADVERVLSEEGIGSDRYREKAKL